MSDLTPELNLALCVDDDDTADYLVTPAGLHGSLLTLDGLFSSATGHNHSGAHQGGGFTNLTIGQDLTVTRDLTVNRNSNLLGTAHVVGAVTLDATLNVGGVTTLASLTVTGVASLATVSASGGITAAGSIQSTGGAVAAGVGLPISPGDVSANRGNGQAFVFLASVSHYLAFDGTNYVMPGGNLYVNGDQVALVSASQTLANKTFSGGGFAGSISASTATINNPTINNPTLGGVIAGTPTWSGTQTFAQGTRIGSWPAVGAHSSNWVIDAGQAFMPTIGSGGTTTMGINFNAAFPSPPIVVCVPQAWSGGIGTIGQMNWEVQGVTTNGFTVAVYNTSGATQNCQINWMAFGS